MEVTVPSGRCQGTSHNPSAPPDSMEKDKVHMSGDSRPEMASEMVAMVTASGCGILKATGLSSGLLDLAGS